MFILVHHQVRDPATFWGMISDIVENPLEGLRLLQSLPSGNASVEFSLWETPALDALQAFIAEHLDLVSSSTMYPVEAPNAYGLPVSLA